MALIWADGFDHQGSLANCLPGYQFFGSNYGGIAYSNANARTGNCIRFTQLRTSYFRRVLDEPSDIIGVSIANRLDEAGSEYAAGLKMRPASIFIESATFGTLCRVAALPNLGVGIFNSADALIGQSVPNLVALTSYQHWEVKVTRDPVSNTASIEVRLDSQPVVTVHGLAMAVPIGSITIGNLNGDAFAVGADWYVDDFIIWDTSGNTNNDWLSDRRCVTLFPNADTVEQDWVPSTGVTGWNLLDETPYDIGDFVTANNNGDISSFEKSASPVEVIGIAGVRLVAVAWRNDAGLSGLRVGISNNGILGNSERFVPSLVPSFYSAIFNNNPATGLPWSLNDYENSIISIMRDDPA